MEKITDKFGGSSLADASQIRKVEEILKADPKRRYVVVSAPGKRFSGDIKVTDMLYAAFGKASVGSVFYDDLKQIRTRYEGIIEELGISFDLESEMLTIEEKLNQRPEKEYTASRGEYLNAKIIAAYLGRPFLDTADLILFNENGSLNEEETDRRLKKALSEHETAVLPGFYGADSTGRIRTFSRGGSDVTGSLVARASDSDLYENWTDVSGMLFTDPRIVENPKTIEYITYEELRELSYMGASVLHEDAVFPVRKAGISINIRNTNAPEDKGTMIVPKLPEGYEPGPITGIAGKKGFANIYVEKAQMNTEVGFGAKLLDIFAYHGIPFEHCPTGIDTIAVVVNGELFKDKKEAVLQDIRTSLSPDVIRVEEGVSVIAVVGEGIVGHYGVAYRVFKGVADAHVNVRMIDSGAGEKNIILSVLDEDFEDTIRGIYREFAREE